MLIIFILFWLLRNESFFWGDGWIFFSSVMVLKGVLRGKFINVKGRRKKWEDFLL